MPVYGLIGYPLTHSFSKKYFDQKFREQDLEDCRYELFEMPSLDGLKKLLKEQPLLAGLNVTIPYKKEVLHYLDSAEQIPAQLKACNCIKITGGRLYGYNTDCIGFERSLLPLLKPHHKKALVMGSGGSADAVVYVLHKLGIEYSVVSRQKNKTGLSYPDLGREMINEYSIIINTTPLGMYPDINNCPDIPYQFIGSKHLLYDLVYNPAKTLFLQKGEAQGANIKNGEEMLTIQAEESWKIWNRSEPASAGSER